MNKSILKWLVLVIFLIYLNCLLRTYTYFFSAYGLGKWNNPDGINQFISIFLTYLNPKNLLWLSISMWQITVASIISIGGFLFVINTFKELSFSKKVILYLIIIIGVAAVPTVFNYVIISDYLLDSKYFTLPENIFGKFNRGF